MEPEKSHILNKGSYRRKWFVSIYILTLTPVVCILSLFYYYTNNELMESKKKVAVLVGNTIEEAIVENLKKSDFVSITTSINRLTKNLSIAHIAIFDSENEIIHANPSDNNLIKQYYKFLKIKSSLFIKDDVMYCQRTIHSSQNNLIGSLQYSLSVKDLISKRYTYLFVFASTIVLLAFILIFITTFLFKKFYSPFNDIFSNLYQMTNGKFEKLRKYENRSDELGSINRAYNNIVERFIRHQEQLKQATKNQAIVSTTQMLAHDVRKPFSQIKLILSSFEHLKSNPSVLNRAKKDVEKAIRNVESMVSDIMDISREVDLKTEPKSLGNIIDFVIRQVFQEYPEVFISLDYSFNAKNKPLVDEERIARVFANILGNAIEAITIIGGRDKGNIAFKTNEITPDMIEITIFNDGPCIPDNALTNLFESSYTSGKNKGTGLGLASAKKIISLHKGEIFAKNHEGKGVEFVVQLPISSHIDQISTNKLPVNSSQLHNLNDNLSGAELLLRQLEEQNKSDSPHKMIALRYFGFQLYNQ